MPLRPLRPADPPGLPRRSSTTPPAYEDGSADMASRTSRPTPRVKVLIPIRVTPSAKCSTVTSEVVRTERCNVTVESVPVTHGADDHLGAARTTQPLHHLADRSPRCRPPID